MQRSTLLSILVFIVGISLIFFFVLPIWDEISILKLKKEEIGKEVDSLRSIIIHIDDLSAKYNQASADLDKLALAIPSDQQLPELLIQFEEMVKRNGLVTTGIKLENTEEAPKDQIGARRNIKSLSVSVSVDGSYSGFKGFLEDIEKNVRMMDVSAISFTKPTDEKSEVAKFSVKLNSYYLAK